MGAMWQLDQFGVFSCRGSVNSKRIRWVLTLGAGVVECVVLSSCLEIAKNICVSLRVSGSSGLVG